jgi:NADH-quinone oxidoreductase subunit L
VLVPLFIALENKWCVDEGYWVVFVNCYIALAHWLAEKVEWAFWHEWFHDTVLVRGFNFLSQKVLHLRLDRQVVDAFLRRAGHHDVANRPSPQPLAEWLRSSYALMVLSGVVLILGYLLLKG